MIWQEPHNVDVASPISMVLKVSPRYVTWWTVMHLDPLGLDELDRDRDGEVVR